MFQQETDRFECQDDNGNLHTVIEYTRYNVFNPIDGSSQEIEGSKSLNLSNGHSVNDIDGETFQVVETDLIIRKV